MRTIQFYRQPNGECPVETFLDALSGKRAQKNGFAKKTQKTPAKEIATALRRRAE